MTYRKSTRGEFVGLLAKSAEGVKFYPLTCWHTYYGKTLIVIGQRAPGDWVATDGKSARWGYSRASACENVIRYGIKVTR